MSLINYEPWNVLNQLHDEVNRMFERRYPTRKDDTTLETNWFPSTDIKEEDSQFLITTDLPGLDKKDISIDIHENVLTIKGERKLENKTEEEGFLRIERSSGSFYRRFALPELVEAKEIQAKYKNGVLNIILPKKKAREAKKIEIKLEE